MPGKTKIVPGNRRSRTKWHEIRLICRSGQTLCSPYHAKRTWRGADRHTMHWRSAVSPAAGGRARFASSRASSFCFAWAIEMRSILAGCTRL